MLQYEAKLNTVWAQAARRQAREREVLRLREEQLAAMRPVVQVCCDLRVDRGRTQVCTESSWLLFAWSCSCWQVAAVRRIAQAARCAPARSSLLTFTSCCSCMSDCWESSSVADMHSLQQLGQQSDTRS